MNDSVTLKTDLQLEALARRVASLSGIYDDASERVADMQNASVGIRQPAYRVKRMEDFSQRELARTAQSFSDARDALVTHAESLNPELKATAAGDAKEQQLHALLNEYIVSVATPVRSISNDSADAGAEQEHVKTSKPAKTNYFHTLNAINTPAAGV